MKHTYKIIFLTLVVLHLSTTLKAQGNTWTLVNGIGTDTSSPLPVYGIKGKPSLTNNPGGKEGSANWLDANNNLWLYGGYGYVDNNNSAPGCEGDLWKYNINLNEWTWVNGNDTLNKLGNYGTKGMPADTTVPPSKTGSGNWIDNEGNLWLFGGTFAYPSYCNDLWKYNISANQWTWVSGDSSLNQKGIYGIKGVGAVTNTPGARSEPACWTDKAGLFWLFGGFGYDNSGNVGNLNDLWQYNSSANQWTWVSGDSLTKQAANYGKLGKSSAANVPDARVTAANWIDATGNLWFFGGLKNSNIFGFSNDLWNYNISTNEWTWMYGSDTIKQSGNYGTQGVAATTNIPGARETSAYWTDAKGDFWLFGGQGYDSEGALGLLNDLWKYSVDSAQWIWVGGSDQINPASVNNYPIGRVQAACWTDSSGSFWMFGGGLTIGVANSLWKYIPDTTASATAAINPITTTSFTVYPNPGNGAFTVDLPEAAQVSVYGTLGDLIVTETLPKGKQPLNLTNKPAGVYYLKANSNNSQQVVKFIIE